MNRKLDGLKVVTDAVAVAASDTNAIMSVSTPGPGTNPALTAQVRLQIFLHYVHMKAFPLVFLRPTISLFCVVF